LPGALARRKGLRAGDRRRKPAKPGRFGRLTRTPVLIGALIAVSIFIRNHAAARFDRLFACTAQTLRSAVLFRNRQGELTFRP
jgi:hypothetical protein